MAFEALDEDRSGVLTKDLLAYVLKRLRPKYSASKIEVSAAASHEASLPTSSVSPH